MRNKMQPVTFPFDTVSDVANDTLPGPTTARPQTSLENKTISLLLVEDEPSDIALAYEMLESGMSDYSWDIHTTARVDDAITMLADNRFDVALVDLSVSDMQGPGIVDILCLAAPELPFIVYTGTTNPLVLAQSLENGANAYIQKNKITPDALRAVIQSAMTKRPEDKS